MVSVEAFRKMALALPDTTEQPHFEKNSFRVGKKIFATYDKSVHRVCVKLSEKEQDVFCLYDRTIMYPVPNAWGKLGWTYVELNKVPKSMLADALKTAYTGVGRKSKVPVEKKRKTS